jgi:Domain of unknown function (DUF4124)
MTLARRRITSITLTLLTAASAVVFSSSAFAQWIWKDEGGHTIASDQPPPPNTPASRIIKQPRARTPAPAGAPAPDANAAPAQKSVAERELESKQKAKETAEAQKKADDDAARAKGLKDNCAQMKGNVAALQAGGRISRYNDKGEKIYIDDNQRAAEIARQQSQLSQSCNN